MIGAQTREKPILQTCRGSDGASHDARELTAGGATANIVLDGKVYTLRITRAGKLILTK